MGNVHIASPQPTPQAQEQSTPDVSMSNTTNEQIPSETPGGDWVVVPSGGISPANSGSGSGTGLAQAPAEPQQPKSTSPTPPIPNPTLTDANPNPSAPPSNPSAQVDLSHAAHPQPNTHRRQSQPLRTA